MLGKIPPRFAGYRFDNPGFVIDSNNRAAVEAAKAFVAAWPDVGGRGLLFAGGPGRGKTVIAACIANAVGPDDVYWASTSEFLDALRPENGEQALRERADRCYYGPGEYGNCAGAHSADGPVCAVCRVRTGDYTGPLERAKSAPLLVLDDLGTAKPSEFVAERLYLLINHRLEAMAPVIVTTNYTLEELAGRPERGIPSRLGHERTASRLVELCDVYRLTGPDRRVVAASRAVRIDKAG